MRLRIRRVRFYRLHSLFFLLIRPLPISTLFPYTTLFRSVSLINRESRQVAEEIALSGMVLLKNEGVDRKSTRLNSSHRCISYAVFCLKKKKRIHASYTSHTKVATGPACSA